MDAVLPLHAHEHGRQPGRHRRPQQGGRLRRRLHDQPPGNDHGDAHAGRHVRAHFNAGISLPTGSIDEEDDTPAGPDRHLPYPMQLGSGTYDLLPGVTYLGHGEQLSWGSQLMGTVRLGDNDNDHTLGDRVQLTGWISRKLSHTVSGSLRLAGSAWQNIDGEDEELPSMAKNMVPTADPKRRGGKRLDVLVGLDMRPGNGTLSGHRLALEIGMPAYQDLDGPQLETDWTVTAGWQYGF